MEDTRHGFNESKGLVLLVLYRQSGRLTSGDLEMYSGLSHSYLQHRLGRWTAWGYISRRATVKSGKAVFAYSLRAKGLRLLDALPNLELLEGELDAITQRRLERQRAFRAFIQARREKHNE